MQETQEMRVRSLDQEDPLEKGVATHSSILAWRIPWTEKPGGLQPIGSQRLKRLSMHACMWKITWVLRVRAPQNILKGMLPWPCYLLPIPHAFYSIPTHALLVNSSHSFLVSLSCIVSFAVTLVLKKQVCPSMTAILENNLSLAWILCLFMHDLVHEKL